MCRGLSSLKDGQNLPQLTGIDQKQVGREQLDILSAADVLINKITSHITGEASCRSPQCLQHEQKYV